jgi:hypothetical protein
VAIPLLAAVAATVFFVTRKDDKKNSFNTDDIEVPGTLGDSKRDPGEEFRGPADPGPGLQRLAELAQRVRIGEGNVEHAIEEIDALRAELESAGVAGSDIQELLGYNWDTVKGQALDRLRGERKNAPVNFNTDSIEVPKGGYKRDDPSDNVRPTAPKPMRATASDKHDRISKKSTAPPEPTKKVEAKKGSDLKAAKLRKLQRHYDNIRLRRGNLDRELKRLLAVGKSLQDMGVTEEDFKRILGSDAEQVIERAMYEAEQDDLE